MNYFFEMKNLSLAFVTLVVLASCASGPQKSQPDSPQTRYLFSWGVQKSKVPNKVLKSEVRRMSLSHYYHNETGATPDVVLVGRPPQKFGESLPNLFALQIYQSLKDPNIKLQAVLKKGEYFDLNKSGSAEVLPFAEATEGNFKTQQAYWIRKASLNWGKGKSVFFVTQKKAQVTESDFLKKLFAHLNVSKNIFGSCSDAFVVFVGSEYTISFLHFRDNKEFESCVFSADGQKTIDDLKTFSDVSLVAEILPARTGDLQPGESVKVITK